MNKYYFYGVLVVFVSCLSQILLKKAANKNSGIKMIANMNVLLAYGILFVVMFINSRFIYKHISLGEISIIESFGYIFVPLFSFFLLKEKISRKELLGILLIVVGIFVYSM